MDTIKAKSYKLVEKKEFKNLEVLTYLVDEEFYVNIINKYTVFEDKLMIDYRGIYSTDLIKKYGTRVKFSSGIRPMITLKLNTQEEKEIIKEVKEFLK